jgi:hypothetical protein
MCDTTNITQLPPSQTQLPPQLVQNVVLNTQETTQETRQDAIQDNAMQKPTMFSSDDQMNFIKNINNAAQQGGTQLPSRDIPRNVNEVVSDPKSRVDFVDSNTENDYIGNYDTEENIIKQQKIKDTNKSTFNKAYEEFQIPIIIGILFFLFQIPIFNNILIKFIPKLSDNSGNLKMQGIMFKSILFGFIFYMISKFSDIIINKIL